MNILVTGGAGFVGLHTVNLLLGRGHGVTVFDNMVRGDANRLPLGLSIIIDDVRDPDAVAEAVRGCDAVLHLAALWLNECKDYPREGWEVNVNGTLNVVEACAESKVRLVFASSASVYGQPSYLPMDEGHPLNDSTLYGASKIAGERLLRAYHDMRGLQYMALRYFNVFGSGQDDKGAYVGVIAKSLKRMKEGLPPIIYGTGEQSYDFVYVKDIARANVLALEGDACDTINICTGKATSVNEVISVLMAAMGSAGEPERVLGGGPVTSRLGDPSRASALLRFKAEVSLEEGLRSYASAK